MKMSGRDHGSVDVRLIGEPLEGGGIAMTESAVSLGPPIQPQLFGGKIVSLNGTKIRASVADAKGRSVPLMLDLSLDPANETVSGTLRSQGSPSGRGA
jgi:hypothetical protein